MYFYRLRETREKAGHTQRKIGELLGMTHTQYIKYEKGYITIPTEVLIKFCKLYEVSADYILELD